MADHHNRRQGPSWKAEASGFLLYYRRGFPLPVVEAKEIGLPAETDVQQAR
jgi:type I restriction enzyme R subunit